MNKSVSIATRQFVALRADYRCEYCRKPELIANFAYHVEHIIGRQHQGSDRLDNLAYACYNCNWKKGPNISTLLIEAGPIVPLFHPRKNVWMEHFYVAPDGLIHSKTDIGEGTLRLLEFNSLDRVLERKLMVELGLFI
jgi:hypothetical protein